MVKFLTVPQFLPSSSLRCFSPFPVRRIANCNPRWSCHLIIFFFVLFLASVFTGSFYVVHRSCVPYYFSTFDSLFQQTFGPVLNPSATISNSLMLRLFFLSFSAPLLLSFPSLLVNPSLLLVHGESKQISEILGRNLFSKTCDANWK